MTVTTTNRLLMSKPDDDEFVSVALLNANWDKADADFRPAAKMVASAAQSIVTATTTKCAYNVTNFDSYAARPEGAMINLTNDEITIRKAGLYLVTTSGSFAANATGVRRLDIRKNGTSLVSDTRVASAQTCGLHLAGIFAFAVNDLITAACFQNSGGNLNIDGNTFADGMELSVLWLGSSS